MSGIVQYYYIILYVQCKYMYIHCFIYTCTLYITPLPLQFFTCWGTLPIVYCISFLFNNSLVAFGLIVIALFFSSQVYTCSTLHCVGHNTIEGCPHNTWMFHGQLCVDVHSNSPGSLGLGTAHNSEIAASGNTVVFIVCACALALAPPLKYGWFTRLMVIHVQ